MKTFVLWLAMIALCLFGTSCVSYSGVTQSPDGQLYVSGGTSYVFFTSPWVRRCEVDGLKLNCVELSESPSSARGAAASGAAATPAPTSEPAATPEPAPEPEAPPATPAKSKK